MYHIVILIAFLKREGRDGSLEELKIEPRLVIISNS